MQIAQTFASKATVAVVATAMLFSAIAAPAKAQTMTQEQLLKMISDLQAQLNGLQGQGGTSSSIASGICPFTWTRDLKTGANGADVMKLQQFLNSNADTRVSASGAGSVGAETMTFGPMTAAAVSKFQVMHRADILTPAGLTNPTGFFGPSTRAKANALCVAVVAPTPTPTPTSTTPTPTPTPTLGNGEGSIDKVTEVSADETSIREGENNGIFAFEAEITGDVSVDRVDFYADVSGGSTRADDYFKGASLMVDGKKVASLDVSDFTEDTYDLVSGGSSKEYRIRFSGLNLTFKDGDVPQFQLALDANNTIDTGDQSATWYIDTETDAIRFVDGKGFSDTAGLSKENSYSIDSQLVAELTVSEAVDSPDDKTIEVSDTATTKDVPVAVFTLREKNDVDVTVDDLTVTITATNTVTNESIVARTASVWDGSTKLASKTVTDGGVVHFENMGLDIAGNDRKDLTVKLELGDVDNYVEGETVTVAFTSVDAATDKNGNNEGDMTITSGPITSGTHTLRSQGLSITKDSTSNSLVTDSNDSTKNYGDYNITFDVTAFGDDLYIPLTAARGVNATVGVAYRVEDSNGNVISTGTTTGASLSRVSGGNVTGQYVQITDGGSAKFTLNVPFDAATQNSYRVQILSVGYTTVASGNATAAQDVTPAEDFETGNRLVTN